MLCPHCGSDNPAGRKYCRSCTKSLSGETASPKPAPSSIVPVPIEPPAVNKMAVVSLALSFLALIFPIGIASVVMGHISRKQIAASRGRQTGTGVAFAALILSYGQLFVVLLLFFALAALWGDLNRHLDKDPYVRAALVERLLNGDPNHPSASVMAKNGENVMDVLHLIPARQEAYQADHGGNVSCVLVYLYPGGRDDELTVHMRDSHYAFQFGCRGLNSDGKVVEYAVGAFPRSESNPPHAPIFCLDESKIIRRYTDDKEKEVLDAVLYQHQPCPEDGEPVE